MVSNYDFLICAGKKCCSGSGLLVATAWLSFQRLMIVIGQEWWWEMPGYWYWTEDHCTPASFALPHLTAPNRRSRRQQPLESSPGADTSCKWVLSVDQNWGLFLCSQSCPSSIHSPVGSLRLAGISFWFPSIPGWRTCQLSCVECLLFQQWQQPEEEEKPWLSFLT